MFCYNNIWRIATNGTIDAFKAELSLNDVAKESCMYRSFGDLFMSAIEDYGLDLTTLNKNYTYMFELVSPYNRVVIDYPHTSIYHIGTRDNDTLKELDIYIGIKKPMVYTLNSLEECIKSSEKIVTRKRGICRG